MIWDECGEIMRITGRKLRPEEQEFMDKLYLEMSVEKALFRYANKFIIDKSFVDDVIQETFLIACMKIDKLMASSKPKGYIMYILENSIKNFNRVRNNIIKMLADVSIEDWLKYHSGSVEQEDDLDLLYGDLVKYKEYEILKKFAVEDKSVSAIAKELNISENACKLRIFKAKRKLKEILEEKNKKI